MPFVLYINITNDQSDDDVQIGGDRGLFIDGRYGTKTYETASDCNAAAAASLYTWLGENCSEWKVDGVTHGMFEGDESGCAMYTYSETARMRGTGQTIELIAQFFGREL